MTWSASAGASFLSLLSIFTWLSVDMDSFQQTEMPLNMPLKALDIPLIPSAKGVLEAQRPWIDSEDQRLFSLIWDLRSVVTECASVSGSSKHGVAGDVLECAHSFFKRFPTLRPLVDDHPTVVVLALMGGTALVFCFECAVIACCVRSARKLCSHAKKPAMSMTESNMQVEELLQVLADEVHEDFEDCLSMGPSDSEIAAACIFHTIYSDTETTEQDSLASDAESEAPSPFEDNAWFSALEAQAKEAESKKRLDATDTEDEAQDTPTRKRKWVKGTNGKWTEIWPIRGIPHGDLEEVLATPVKSKLVPPRAKPLREMCPPHKEALDALVLESEPQAAHGGGFWEHFEASALHTEDCLDSIITHNLDALAAAELASPGRAAEEESEVGDTSVSDDLESMISCNLYALTPSPGRRDRGEGFLHDTVECVPEGSLQETFEDEHPEFWGNVGRGHSSSCRTRVSAECMPNFDLDAFDRSGPPALVAMLSFGPPARLQSPELVYHSEDSGDTFADRVLKASPRT